MMKIHKITLVFLLLLTPFLSKAQISSNTHNGLTPEIIRINIEQGIIIKEGSFIIKSMDIISPYIPIDEPIYNLDSTIPTDSSRGRNEVIRFGIEDDDDDDRFIIRYTNLRIEAP